MLKNRIIFTNFKVSSRKQGIAPLLRDKIIESLIFLTCEIDIGRSIYIRTKTGSKKFKIFLFTSVYRASHLEVASNFSTENFIISFKVYISHRGLYKKFFTDNVKTFIKINYVLNKN